jgi:purine-nucleoside phosphorylase
MKDYVGKVKECADYLQSQITVSPEVGLLTGTGLGRTVAGFSVAATLPYQTIPHFPAATVQSHAGQLVLGSYEGRGMVAMQGRFHLYEGYSPRQVTFPIRVMAQLGVRVLILSNAAGGLNPRFSPGDIMIIADHLNLTGENPLVGPNVDEWGLRFPDMAGAYDRELAALARQVGSQEGIAVQTGVYAGLKGPSLETPAEVRFIKSVGGDAVGFSTVQESIAAVHAGMRVLGLSVITNVNDPDQPVPATVEDIIAVAQETAPRLERLIAGVLERLP